MRRRVSRRAAVIVALLLLLGLGVLIGFLIPRADPQLSSLPRVVALIGAPEWRADAASPWNSVTGAKEVPVG